MDIVLTPLLWIMAVLPIIVLILLMTKFNLGAMKAAPIGLIIAILTGIYFFKADLFLIWQEMLKGMWSTLVVIFVVVPAILLYEVVSKANAFDTIRKGLQKSTPHELLQLLALGWVFISFLQGITGFGVPVAVGAPLLVGIGVAPIPAVLIPLIGHAWANTFGTLAVAWDALTLQTDLLSNPDLFLRTAFYAAIFIWILNFIAGISISWLYGKGEALKEGFPAIVLLSLIQGGGQLLLTQFNTTLAGFVPAVLSILGIFLLNKTKRYGKSWKIEDSPIMNRELLSDKKIKKNTDNMKFTQAIMPYIVLTLITLFVLLIPAVKDFFGQIKIGFSFPETSTGYGFINPEVDLFSPLAIFTHAGFFLILSSITGFLFYKRNNFLKKNDLSKILKDTITKASPSTIAVLCFVSMSRIMSGTGQTIILAEGIANVLGEYYAVLSPVIGMLGSFMTSSNMASNILFAEFQMTTASILELDTAVILGAQTSGGAIGNTLSPGNIILGTTTAGILGKEGEVLNKVLPITITIAVIVGALSFFLAVN